MVLNEVGESSVADAGVVVGGDFSRRHSRVCLRPRVFASTRRDDRHRMRKPILKLLEKMLLPCTPTNDRNLADLWNKALESGHVYLGTHERVLGHRWNRQRGK